MTNPINIKDFQQGAFGDNSPYGYDPTHNVLDFKKNPMKFNPWASMTFNWQVVQARKQFIAWVTLPLVIQGEFWNTWSNVYNPKGKE